MKPRKKGRFSIKKLEERIAPNLTLPSGQVVFEGFDNQGPQPYHSNFYRSGTAIETTAGLAGTNPTIQNVAYGQEGPWAAHFMSDRIGCTEC